MGNINSRRTLHSHRPNLSVDIPITPSYQHITVQSKVDSTSGEYGKSDSVELADGASLSKLALLINSRRETLSIRPILESYTAAIDASHQQQPPPSVSILDVAIPAPLPRSQSVKDVRPPLPHASADAHKRHTDSPKYHTAATTTTMQHSDATTPQSPSRTAVTSPHFSPTKLKHDVTEAGFALNHNRTGTTLPQTPQLLNRIAYSPQRSPGHGPHERGSLSKLKEHRRSFSLNSPRRPSLTSNRTITDRPVLVRLSDQWRSSLAADPLLYVSPEFAAVLRSSAHVWCKYCVSEDVYMREQSLLMLCTDILTLYTRQLRDHIVKRGKHKTDSAIDAAVQRHIYRVMKSTEADARVDWLCTLFSAAMDVNQDGLISRGEFMSCWEQAVTAFFATITHSQLNDICCTVM